MAASSPRIHCPVPLAEGQQLSLPPGAARHVQVLRMQPGQTVTLFNGEGGEYEAVIGQMGRSEVTARVGRHVAAEREPARAVHLAVGMPANERMDWLVEKAAELGAASVQPLVCERSVLRLAGERAEKKRKHWQSVAIAACEQCGGNRVPQVHPVAALPQWLARAPAGGTRVLLSPRASALALPQAVQADAPVWLLSGPEGGFSALEEDLAAAAGFRAAHLGPRVLRADTAPLAALALLTLGTR
ncbi:MAG: 16S rRNA (uracil(1498)-N(3))-methyltransferase [Pseudomonadota bacterium]